MNPGSGSSRRQSRGIQGPDLFLSLSLGHDQGDWTGDNLEFLPTSLGTRVYMKPGMGADKVGAENQASTPLLGHGL